MDRKADSETLSLLKAHLDFLREKFKPEMILLFGSRARGDNLKESDIDLLLVSKEFEGVPFIERMALAYGMWDKKEDLEQICYTPSELGEMSERIGIVQSALKEGINIL